MTDAGICCGWVAQFRRISLAINE